MNERRMRVELIFNPISGSPDESSAQLMEIIREMQTWNLVPEPYLVGPDSDLQAVVRDALWQGIHLVVVCGGDGTIDLVAGALAGTPATLGIIPTGTRNNVALSLGIPTDDIPAAVAILRSGRRIKVDVGSITCCRIRRPFMEACSVGLLSALFPAADDIQHGNLARVGDLLAALVTSPPAEMDLVLDGRKKIHTVCHVVLISNMPYVGPNYQVSAASSAHDGLLDVLVFADLSKLELLGYAIQVAGSQVAGDGLEDPRIQHYQVRRVDIDTDPAVLILTDGMTLGEGPVHVSVRRHALAVMVGKPAAGGCRVER